MHCDVQAAGISDAQDQTLAVHSLKWLQRLVDACGLTVPAVLQAVDMQLLLGYVAGQALLVLLLLLLLVLPLLRSSVQGPEWLLLLLLPLLMLLAAASDCCLAHSHCPCLQTWQT